MQADTQRIPVRAEVALVGELFVDVVFAQLNATPTPGTESFARSMTVAPGGIANSAVALARLGVRASLISDAGDDWFGTWLMDALRKERIDVADVRAQATTSVTASLAYDGDRSMVTYSPSTRSDANTPSLATPDAIVIDLGSPQAAGSWWREAADSGAKVYADTRWGSGTDWPERGLRDLARCRGFLPNAAEALSLTRTDTVHDALHRLALRVPVAVVTCGADGVRAIDSVTGEEASAPAVEVDAVDTTGAGDVFVAAFAVADLDGLALEQRLSFATLCSGLSTTRSSGSFGAPAVGDLRSWWASRSTDPHPDIPLLDRYAFLDDYLPALDARRGRSAGL